MPEYRSVLEEHSDKPLDYDLLFLVRDQQVAQTKGREALTAIWQEFHRYLGKFDGEDMPVPDFHDGDDFIRKPATQEEGTLKKAA